MLTNEDFDFNITFNDTEFLNSQKLTDDENVCDKNAQKDYGKEIINNEFCNNIAQSYNNINFDTSLSTWGLPESVLKKYNEKGISNMFKWQVECLGNKKILENSNLVYSAPTSAGKTLVAEILALKTLLEKQKKVIIILPFVSVVREKMFYFQDILSLSGIRVEGFMGSHSPPGGFKAVQLAICTIEKANSIVNKLLEEDTLRDVGAVIIDEIHLLGDPSRGYLLELLLTKLRYMSARNNDITIQLIGMSATLPNLHLLAKWLNAELYTTNFRPIPLEEFYMLSGEIMNTNNQLFRRLELSPDLTEDTDNILQLCLETIKNSCSVLIFCPTKNWCENLAQQISSAFFKLGRSKSHFGLCLREQLDSVAIGEILEQLKGCPVGLDLILKKTVSFGVAFHHAGLTMDERDIIEGAFRSGALRVLVTTSTLSSGVNLPAQRVIIRTPMFHGKPLDSLTYRQMIGRAGRMGKDTSGESILICQKTEKRIAEELISAKLHSIESCLEGAGKLKRAILEVIASGVATTPEDVNLFTSCTLLAASVDGQLGDDNPIDKSVEFLISNEFIRLQKNDQGELKYIATCLAKACLSSSMPPEDGLALFEELERARQCFVLDSDLHLLYLVTPYSVCSQWSNLDWMLYLDYWEKLSPSMKRVADMVGVQESFIFNATRGKMNTNTSKQYHKLQIHRRFYTALALQDLVNEVPLNKVANKFQCSRGMLQSLQQSASMFAGMVSSFCYQLGWKTIEILISQFQDRLQFGIQHELLDLMKLPNLNGPRARALYNTGIESLSDLASVDVCKLENVLLSAVPFESEKEREGETAYDVEQKKKIRGIFITGKQGLTAREAANMLIKDARDYLQLEIGAAVLKWNATSTISKNNSILNDTSISSSNSSHMVSSDLKEIHDQNNEIYCIDKSTPQININDQIENDDNISSFIETSNTESNNMDLNISEINSDDDEKNGDCNWTPIDCEIPSFSIIMNQESKKISRLSLNDSNKSGSLFEESITLDSKLCNVLDSSSYKEVINLEEKDEIKMEDTSFFNNIPNSFNIEKSPKKTLSNSSENIFDVIDTSQSEIKDYSINSLYDSLKKGTPRKRSRKSECKNNINLLDTLGSPSKKKKYDHDMKKNLTTDFSALNIVDVCRSKVLFDTFCKEIKMQSELSFALACEYKKEDKPLIGQNIVNLTNNPKETEINHICVDERLITGVAISCGENISYFISFTNEEHIKNKDKLLFLRDLMQNKNNELRIFDYKEYAKIIYKFLNVNIECQTKDPKVADWLVDPEGKEKSLTAISLKYDSKLVELSKLAGVADGSRSVALDIDNAISNRLRASVEAIVTWHLIEALKNYLAEQEMKLLQTFEIEMRSISCLAQMEIVGFRVDKDKTNQIISTIKQEMNLLQQQAFSLAGRQFSLFSTKDVAKVIGIYKGKKVNTNKQTLEQNENPISKIILQWRKLSCTLQKMLFPILKSLKGDRIHGCCVTHSATGRISMHDPNLQNVPRNYEIEKLNKTVVFLSVRSSFIPGVGKIFLSADYCQLELRLLAHLSQDSVLCNIMKSEEDVFKSIAAKLNKISKEEVTDVLRQRAKQLCYGIIYGMGAKSLADQLNSTENDAVQFIVNFKNTYPKIQHFIQQTIEKCKREGFVETLAARRRYLQNINSENISHKSQAERQAVNTVIQGSAADIAKNAMISIDKKLKSSNKTEKNKTFLVLHLHDELLYEVPLFDIERVAKIVKECMENSVKLSIPFPVKLKTGPSWGELKEYSVIK